MTKQHLTSIIAGADNEHSAQSSDTQESSSQQSTDTAKHVKQGITPLPKRQLFILCCARFGEPVSFTVLFPFMYFVSD
jgi:hypothetical protein